MNRFSRMALAALLSLALAGSAALAAAGGNGNGNGNAGGNGNGNAGGNANSGGAAANSNGEKGNSNKVQKKTDVAAKQKKEKSDAAKFGKLNGFLHASPQAIANASPKSAIGKVAKVYAGLLGGYLSPVEGQTAPSAADVAAALQAAANKPVDASVVAAVNTKLLSVNPQLASDLAASGKTPEQLASEIAAAL